MEIFKIRCSAIGHIMTGDIGLNPPQQEKYEILSAKPTLTEKQEIALRELQHKKDNPELPKGAQTYCRDWFKGQMYKRQVEIKSKYLDKGNIMEDHSLDLVAEKLDLGLLLKNEDYFKDSYMRGTPDALLPELVIDVKNSWDWTTFPLLEKEVPNRDYYWQLQGYMNLADKPAAKLIYTLLDTPEHLIEREARYYAINNGYEALTKDIYNRFKAKMTYSDLPDELRYKSFDIERNPADIVLITERVKMCRVFIKTLHS